MLRLALVGVLIGLCIAQRLPGKTSPTPRHGRPSLKPTVTPYKPMPGCSRDKMFECREIFYNDMAIAAQNGHAIHMNPVVAFCRNFYEIDMCMSPVMSECSPEIRGLMNAAREGYSYLCHNRSEETNKFVTCIMDPVKAKGMEMCYKRLWQEQSDLGTVNHDIQVILPRVCGYVNEYERCVEEVAATSCNSARLVKGFFDVINRNIPTDICRAGQLTTRSPQKTPDYQRPTGMPSMGGMPFDTSMFMPSKDELLCHQPKKAERCLEPIVEAFMMRNTRTVDDICRMASNARRCIKSVSDTCSRESMRIWLTADKLVDYACQEKRHEFAQSFQCLLGMSYELPSTMRKCMMRRMVDDMEYKRDIDSSEERFDEHMRRPFTKQNKMCGMFERYDECIGDEVESQCGEDARDFVEGMFSLTNDFVMEKLAVHCPDGGVRGGVVDSIHRHWRHKMYKMALFTGIPAVVIIIVLIIALVIVCRRKPAAQKAKLDKITLVKHDVLHENMKYALEQSSDKAKF